jgi:hypothetical protein
MEQDLLELDRSGEGLALVVNLNMKTAIHMEWVWRTGVADGSETGCRAGFGERTLQTRKSKYCKIDRGGSKNKWMQSRARLIT